MSAPSPRPKEEGERKETAAAGTVDRPLRISKAFPAISYTQKELKNGYSLKIFARQVVKQPDGKVHVTAGTPLFGEVHLKVFGDGDPGYRFKATHVFRMSQIAISFHGVEKVMGPEMEPKKRHRLYGWYLLFTHQDPNGVIWKPGLYRFPFRVQLPITLLPSYEYESTYHEMVSRFYFLNACFRPEHASLGSSAFYSPSIDIDDHVSDEPSSPSSAPTSSSSSSSSAAPAPPVSPAKVPLKMPSVKEKHNSIHAFFKSWLGHSTCMVQLHMHRKLPHIKNYLQSLSSLTNESFGFLLFPGGKVKVSVLLGDPSVLPSKSFGLSFPSDCNQLIFPLAADKSVAAVPSPYDGLFVGSSVPGGAEGGASGGGAGKRPPGFFQNFHKIPMVIQIHNPTRLKFKEVWVQLIQDVSYRMTSRQSLTPLVRWNLCDGEMMRLNLLPSPSPDHSTCISIPMEISLNAKHISPTVISKLRSLICVEHHLVIRLVPKNTTASEISFKIPIVILDPPIELLDRVKQKIKAQRTKLKSEKAAAHSPSSPSTSSLSPRSAAAASSSSSSSSSSRPEDGGEDDENPEEELIEINHSDSLASEWNEEEKPSKDVE